jgi:hypothetical protein
MAQIAQLGHTVLAGLGMARPPGGRGFGHGGVLQDGPVPRRSSGSPWHRLPHRVCLTPGRLGRGRTDIRSPIILLTVSLISVLPLDAIGRAKSGHHEIIMPPCLFSAPGMGTRHRDPVPSIRIIINDNSMCRKRKIKEASVENAAKLLIAIRFLRSCHGHPDALSLTSGVLLSIWLRSNW